MRFLRAPALWSGSKRIRIRICGRDSPLHYRRGRLLTRSGDLEFAHEQWDSLWKAYGFLQSTYDAQGFAQNAGVGHGWIEGGPLYPVRTETLSGFPGSRGLKALSHLAHLSGKEEVARDLTRDFDRQEPLLDEAILVSR